MSLTLRNDQRSIRAHRVRAALANINKVATASGSELNWRPTNATRNEMVELDRFGRSPLMHPERHMGRDCREDPILKKFWGV
jgi:hypothetical protein